MPKLQLAGSIDEQLATVYDMVQERLANGRYSGAVAYAKEIVKVDPNYRDIQELLRKAQRAKREQTWGLVVSLLAAVAAIALSRWIGLTRDWQMLLFGFVGLLGGFLLANAWFAFRTRS